MKNINGRSQVHEVIFTKGGAKNKYDTTSKSYHLIMGVFEIKLNTEALKMADIRPREEVLDVAFGTGWVLEKLVPLMDKATYVHGIDFSAGMHQETRKRLRNAHFWNRVMLIQGNVLHMPYKPQSFDVLFASFIMDIQSCQDIQRFLTECKRVLRPHGRLVLVAMTKEGEGIQKFARYFYDWFYPFWPTIFGYRASSRPIYVKQEVAKAGFSIVKEKLTYITFFHFPIHIILCTPMEKEIAGD